MNGSNYLLDDPQGIDFAIQRLQKFLFSNLEWDNVEMHGRIDKVPNGEEREGFKPFAYYTSNDYRNVQRDDNYNANIFFVAANRNNATSPFTFTNEVRIVFMVDLKRLYPNYVGRADILAQKDALNTIQTQTAFTVTSIGTGVNESLGEFDNEDVKFTDMHPNHVFCITGQLSYTVSC